MPHAESHSWVSFLRSVNWFENEDKRWSSPVRLLLLISLRNVFFFFTVSGKEGNLLGKRQSLLKKAPLIISRESIRIHNLNWESNCHRMSSSAQVELCFLLRRKIKLFNFHRQTHRGSKMGLVPQQKQIIFWEKSPVIFSLSRHWFKLSVPETRPASLPALFLSLSRFPQEDNHLLYCYSQKVWRCQVNTPLAH